MLCAQENSVTEAELITLYGDAIQRANANFEFWLSGTFAFLLTFFFARERITNSLKWVLSSLYVMFSLLFFLRWYSVTYWTISIREELAAMNASLEMLPDELNSFMGTLYYAIYIIGSVATLYYAFQRDKNSNEDQTEHT